ncbi:hypothetical protein [Nocardia sp. NPDC004860]|uniref:hypothetical protein n=1 Tax=Nocardia sp. NPDC004860 TaxID=3154557 RepID=UPI0033BEEBCE
MPTTVYGAATTAAEIVADIDLQGRTHRARRCTGADSAVMTARDVSRQVYVI